MRYYIDAEIRRTPARMPDPVAEIIDADEEQKLRNEIRQRPQAPIIEA